jgi:tRNA uracil 4-sulfurtransferase
VSADGSLILARYGEMWLKGKNRRDFERTLARNVRAALAGHPGLLVEREHGQLRVMVERRPEEALRRLGDVFGISSLSPARAVAPQLDAIVEVARTAFAELMQEAPRDRRVRVRVLAKRSDKRFPLSSPELARRVAELILGPYVERIVVDLDHAEISLGITVRDDRAYVFAERRPGAGGLPVGTLGRAVCLLSGGIDSPVAAYLAMKRGCAVAFASFHSYPYLGESSKRKIERLVRALARYQPRNRLYVVPFTRIQVAIRDAAPEGYRTILYRRMMQRLAGRIAALERAGAVVTGESLGQVASQTLENLTCIEAASELPVLRPLIAFDKSETIAVARRIGTFAISSEPEPDCCTVFQPARPVIRGTLKLCAAAESGLDLEALSEEAMAGVEIVDLRPD